MSALAAPETIELDTPRQFDFLLGEWDCSWQQDGLEHRGTSSVYLDLGHVVVESFDGRPSLDFQEVGLSVYDRQAKCWKQTRVDSEGRYLDFAGGFEHGLMELRRIGEVDGAPVLFRVRWENIERDAFDWSLQRSVDGGETWDALREAEYRRVL